VYSVLCRVQPELLLAVLLYLPHTQPNLTDQVFHLLDMAEADSLNSAIHHHFICVDGEAVVEWYIGAAVALWLE